MTSKNIGFTTNNIIYLYLNSYLVKNYEVFKSTLLSNPPINGVTKISFLPMDMEGLVNNSNWEERVDQGKTAFGFKCIDFDHLNVIDYKIVEGRFPAFSEFMAFEKNCPVTGLDISMQAKNNKFLSSSGAKWYYENDRKIFDEILASRLTDNLKSKDIKIQFRRIAHSIRNADSNPRNNTRRAIQKLPNEKDSLFNNLQLIDKSKLREAVIKSSLDL